MKHFRVEVDQFIILLRPYSFFFRRRDDFGEETWDVSVYNLRNDTIVSKQKLILSYGEEESSRK